MALDYSQFGGQLITPDHPQAYALIGDPRVTEPIWNFGRIQPASVGQLRKELGHKFRLPRMQDVPSLHEQCPEIKGISEDKTVILPHIAKKVLKSFFQSQYQPRGTCVSRGAKRSYDHCQSLAIFLGEPREFFYSSHALIYGACREYGNYLSRQDGAVGEWAAWAVKNVGNLRNQDLNDDDNKDDLAVEWGYRGVPKDIKKRSIEEAHFIVDIVPIRSVQEAADFICAGFGAITVASNVGYEGQRNSQGVVRRRGSWSHQMMFSAWRHDRKQLLQEQSWGSDQPGGPIGDIEIPSYSWWTESDDAAVQIKENDCFGFKWVKGWKAANKVTHRY